MLGDLVGYGASPGEVVDLVRDLAPAAVIRGNHDKVVAGIESGEEFNRVAMEAARINRLLLAPGHLDYLRGLAKGSLQVGDSFAIAHGTPLDEDEYLVDEGGAASVFAGTDAPLCFFGHTHLPGAFMLKQRAVFLLAPGMSGALLQLEPGVRYLINPGSVGQPRDEDPRASFALFDDVLRQVGFHRAEYPVARARERILEAGLPPILGERLLRGV